MRKHVVRLMIFSLVAATIILLPTYSSQSQGLLQDTQQIRVNQELRSQVQSAVERAIEGLPPAYQNVQLLDSGALGKTIRLNFSQELLSNGLGVELEDALHRILVSIGNATIEDMKDVDFSILVDGTPLHEFYKQVENLEAQANTEETGEDLEPASATPNEVAGLNGKRVVTSAGHGWYWNEGCSCWRLQRSYFWGIVEDFVNAEMVMFLNAELLSVSADVRQTRFGYKSSAIGATGHPKWEEAAKYHIRELGAPSSVWNSASNDLDSDIRSRPLYANWANGYVLVSVHNNGGGGTGTEVWYDSTNGQQAQSQRLAGILRNRVVSIIRARYNPNWIDRGVKSCNGCKGENRIATRPAVIIEVAFMDTRTPDNDALHSDYFKRIVAIAIREGLEEFAR